MRLLGAPEVRHDAAQVTFETRKALALLAYLAVEGGAHRREKLAALFWPESDAEHGRAALRYTLAALRRALGASDGPPHLQVGRDAVRFDPSADFELDLLALEEAAGVAQRLAGGVTQRLAAETPASAAAQQGAIATLEAAAMRWRGELLDGFSLPDAPAFDDWASVQRERWHRRAELVFEQLARAQAAAGARAEATDTAARWVAMSPLNEAAHRQLMQLHLAAGEPATALRAYETCRAVLQRELGTEPDPQTVALAERVRAARPPSERPAPARAAPLPIEGPLVGRAAELVRLIELFQAARQGQSHVAVVRGEAGIGKTRLALEVLEWAQANGADVLRGRAFESGGRLPYQPLVDALRPRLERENAPEDLLADVWLGELSRLLPELRERYPDLPPLAAEETTARTRLFEAIVRLVQALGERNPVVLFLDDVQWADAASLDVLHYAARRWAESRAPALVLLTLRSETLAERPALAEWLAGLRRGASSVELELGPLSLADTKELLASLAGAGADVDTRLGGFARWLFDETGGQPFFLTEMLRALIERGIELQRVEGEPSGLRGYLPPSVREVVSARLARLSSDARALLAAAAVLGQGFTFEQLAQVADVPENAGLPALDEAVRAHLVRESRSRGAYAFTHDKIRDAVHAESGEARRRVYHRRAFEALADGAPAAERARHALAAGLDEPAVRSSLQAGDDAMRLLAGRDAIAHYVRALDVAQRRAWPFLVAEAQFRRARAFASVGQWADAKRDFEAVLASIEPGQTERRAEVVEGLAEASYFVLDVPGVHRHAAEAVELAEQVGRNDLVMAARGWLAGAHAADGQLGMGITEFEQAVGRAQALGVAPPANVLTFHALTLYWLGRLDAAVERSRAGVEAARTANDASVLMYSLPHLGLSLAARGHYAAALGVFDEARRFGREYRVDNLLARAIAMSTGCYLELGDFPSAEALSHEARELALEAGWPPTAASASIDLLFNFVRRGEVGQAETILAEVAGAVETAAGFHGWLWRLRLAEARAEIAAARGSWDEAVRLANLAIRDSRARRRRKYEAAALHTRARALAALGQTEAAVVDLCRALQFARGLGDPALFLRLSPTLLAFTHETALAAEIQTVASAVLQSLPEGPLRSSFAASPLAAQAAR